MMRVLHVIGKRPKGGIGAVVKNYQRYIDKTQVQFDYLIFDDSLEGDFDIYVKNLGSNVYVLPELKNQRVFSLASAIDNFFGIYSKDYQIVHLHSPNIAFMILYSAEKYGIRYRIIHSHATLYSDKKLNALRNEILCIPIKQLANIYMACSEAAGDFLYGKNSRDHVVIVKNAIDCNRYAFNSKKRKEVRQNLELEDKFIVGNVGRFCEQKNQIFLLEIFEEIKKINSHAVLLLVGDGPLLEEVKWKVKQKELEKDVIFLGTREDVPDLLQAMDVFVLPSLFEGLPVIGIEAQASGVPCVISDKVTKELDIFNIKYVSLKKCPKEWADIILEMKQVNREHGLEKVIEAGYEIHKEALKLQDFYLNLK